MQRRTGSRYFPYISHGLRSGLSSRHGKCDLINGTRESLEKKGGGIGGIKTLYQCDMALSAMRTKKEEEAEAPLVDAKYFHGDEENGRLPRGELRDTSKLSPRNLH